MAVLIFQLRHVPDDEAQDIRELLSENDIDFYETSAGMLGFSMPGLWLKDRDQEQKARRLIDEYQQLRQDRVREEYRFKQRTVVDMFKESPVRYISIVLAIVLVSYLMIFAFFTFG